MINSNFKKLMLLMVASAFSFLVEAQTDDAALRAIEAHRKKQQQEFTDPVKSPLDKKQRRKFKGLNYYAPDLNYRVKASFVKNESPVLFTMKTTTTRLPSYRKYGDVYFLLDGEDYKLEVYQNPELMGKRGFEDYLFIPFTDATNGKDTYDIGRYLEFRIPTTDEVILDFNLCYNPYCSYNDRYSCPIPPAANKLPVEIKAGEKKYKTSLLH